MLGDTKVGDTESRQEGADSRIVEQIIEVQREFYFENKNRDSERRRKLREIIERATPLKDV